MSELDDLLRQKAEIEARIVEVRAKEIDHLKFEFAKAALDPQGAEGCFRKVFQ